MKILVVCYANYCRSPVAEKLFNHYCNREQYSFFSRGIIQFHECNMDTRSADFLREKGVEDIFHNPKRITKEDVMSADLVLALDMNVLFELAKKYTFAKNKLKIFSFHSKHQINDPVNLKQVDKYFEIMKKIDYEIIKWNDYFNQQKSI